MTEMERLAEHAVRQAAADLGRLRRHAIWLERIAVMTATFWIAASTYAMLGDPAGSLTRWAAIVTLAVLAWAVLRSLALVLHLRVDEAMLPLADDDLDEPADAATR